MTKLITLLASALLASNIYAADPKADNTENNKVDRKEEAVTSTDQSNSAEDIELVAKIRRMVVDDASLSGNAKNIKIIVTENGPVYLRGVALSAQEKETIASYAKKAGAKEIKNEITIKKETE